MKKKGKFIVIEGIDGSAKETQFQLLKERLKKEGYDFLIADFPRYDSSIWGKLVGQLLTGKLGPFRKINPYLAVMPYMLDEYTWSRDIGRPWVEKGGLIISDRYFTSNIHQIAKMKTKAQKKYREWLWPAGYKDLKIMKPDLVILIDTPPGVARQLIRNRIKRGYSKKQKTDEAEKDWEHQVASYHEYKRTVKENSWWVEVPGIKDSEKDYKQEIHENIWKLVSSRILSKL